MLTADFLTSIWPTQGHYCIAQPRTKGDKSWWQHNSYPTIQEACDKALTVGQQSDVYFTVLALREAYIVDQGKIDKAIAEGRPVTDFTGRTYRSQQNIAWARSYFIDIDVGKADGYSTQSVAFEALKEFIRKTKLPRPWIVSSGVGLHIYWPMAEDIPVGEWKPYAIKLKRICEHQGLKADPVRTADVASVLRVPGTGHFKDKANPKRVRVERDGPVTPFEDWCAAIDRAYQITPTGETYEGDMPSSMQAAPVELPKLREACALVDSMVADPAASNEPKWYKLMGVLKFVEGGRELVHDISAASPHYERSWIDGKLDQLDRTMPDGTTMGPTSCRAMAETCGPAHCATCWFSRTSYYKEGASSPIVAARRMPLDTVDGVPQPPSPYVRTSGGVMMSGDDVPVIVCPFDFYPLSTIEDRTTNTRASKWVMVLPRKTPKELIISNEIAHDANKLSLFIANNGFLPHFEEVKRTKLYMTAYLRELQRYCDDEQQYAHFGWTTDRKSFILPEGEMTGTTLKPVMLATNAMVVSAAIMKKGKADVHLRLLDFYCDPQYAGHQFLIGASLAAPLFNMTNQYGTVVNLTGPSGASKTTALATAAALWGSPETYMLAGTQNASTIKARNTKIATLRNLPICVDEITTMSGEDIRELVMGFTQQTSLPDRLDQNGQLRDKPVDAGKSTLMLCTSNNSIHELLAHRNAAGTAGSMRLFEITAGKQRDENKGRADEYIRQMRTHYGFIGPAWMRWVCGHLDEVVTDVQAEMARLDKMLATQGSERFWSAVAAVTIYTLKRTYALGLLPYDPVALESWLIHQQFSAMRANLASNYDSHLDTLMAYLAHAATHLALMMESRAVRRVVLEKAPSGELAGGLLIDGGTVTCYMSHIKAYAARERIQLNALLSDLEKQGVLTRLRVDPVAGTILSTGAQACIRINLRHPSIAGHAKQDDISNISNVVNMRG